MIAPIIEPLQPGLLMTPSEVADALRVSTRHLSRLTAPHGKLECLRLGPRLVRYERAVVERWIIAQRAKLCPNSAADAAESSGVEVCSELPET